MSMEKLEWEQGQRQEQAAGAGAGTGAARLLTLIAGQLVL